MEARSKLAKAAIDRSLWVALCAVGLVTACAQESIIDPGPPLKDEGDWCDDPGNPVEDCDDEDDDTATGNQPAWEPYWYFDSDIYEAPNDPNPSTSGVWLGSSTTPGACFTAGKGAAAAGDADRDGLKDSCEYRIARSFAPMMSFNPSENCVEAEPYWAAKRFPNGYVSIAYLLSYWRDCGYPGGPGGFTSHLGDSEMVTVMVKFRPSTEHWETVRVWTSAHWGASTDKSRWTTESELDYMPGIRARVYPIIYVAENKHANYADPSCGGDSSFPDWCGGYSLWYWGRVPVKPTKNVGSRYVDLVGCPHSTIKSSPRTECFYKNRKFGGWNVFGDSGVTSYRTIMFGDYNFENFNYGGKVYTNY